MDRNLLWCSGPGQKKEKAERELNLNYTVFTLRFTVLSCLSFPFVTVTNAFRHHKRQLLQQGSISST